MVRDDDLGAECYGQARGRSTGRTLRQQRTGRMFESILTRDGEVSWTVWHVYLFDEFERLQEDTTHVQRKVMPNVAQASKLNRTKLAGNVSS